ncbi:MAG: hypothetical protein SLAVMIC_01011 [uncultured marine phage]|uniref:Uncharacterized protein n=1 Tax=uncultured marine phage TaxID=707152 RepID=A0A8D9CDZ9_9VIRU|nr:MAG: hypothetical protein SLAVMIC_01011 [uncultured marine phage]
MNILKSVKLDKKNKLILVKEGSEFKVISLKKVLFGLGWRKSEYALDYQTNLTGQKIVDGKYNGFKTESNANKYFDFLKNKFSTRVKFIGN